MDALDAAADDFGVERAAIEREHADGGDMRRNVDAEHDRQRVVEPDDLDQKRRASKQLDIGHQQPVDHRKPPQAKDADEEADEGAEQNGADGVGDGPAEPEPEQMAVFAEDREIPNVG